MVSPFRLRRVWSLIAVVVVGGCTDTRPERLISPAHDAALANGAPAGAPLTTVTLTVSENPATVGDVVTITAHATIRATGQDVPASPGQLVIQVCADGLLNTLPAASCQPGGAGSWQELGTGAPAAFTYLFQPTVVDTMGVRALYQPMGSRYAGGPGAPVDLVLQPVIVTVTPVAAILNPGGQAQFTATVTGTSNHGVTWTATGGTISSTGLYTAGAVLGTSTVRATSVVDHSAFGEATVTTLNPVPGGPPPPPPPPPPTIAGTYTGTYTLHEDPNPPVEYSGMAGITVLSTGQVLLSGALDDRSVGFVPVQSWPLGFSSAGGSGFSGTPINCLGGCFPSYPVVSSGSVADGHLTFTLSYPFDPNTSWVFDGQKSP